jgi:hypothetical protein
MPVRSNAYVLFVSDSLFPYGDWKDKIPVFLICMTAATTTFLLPFTNFCYRAVDQQVLPIAAPGVKAGGSLDHHRQELGLQIIFEFEFFAHDYRTYGKLHGFLSSHRLAPDVVNPDHTETASVVLGFALGDLSRWSPSDIYVAGVNQDPGRH